MIIRNVLVYTEEKVFKTGTVRVEGTRITQVCLKEGARKEEAGNEDCLDGEGCYLIPGMIDIHLHGCKGYDFGDGTLEAVQEIAKYQASMGVTGFLPATMTLSIEKLEEILKVGADYVMEKQQGRHQKYADLLGINMEGPFISKAKRGAQNEAYRIPADVEVFHKFQQAAKGLVKYIGIAPEEGDALAFIRQAKDEVTVTLAHSNADYATAKAAFEAGAGHVTHLYNAMSAYQHREPGIVGAVADCKHVEAELICDGVHVHPSVIRNTFAMLGGERILFISDSMRAAGMPDGEYELGGQKVAVKGKLATLAADGTIAGSVTSLPDCLRYAVKEAGISLEQAVACVTTNPAKSLGIYENCGSIGVGKQADLVWLDKDLQVRRVMKAGKLL